VIVLNDTKVRKARVQATRSDTGGAAEFLLVEQVDRTHWWSITNRGKRTRVGVSFDFPEGRRATVVEREAERRLLEFDRPVDEGYLDRVGEVPLPPYIRRGADKEDEKRYQTVYARTIGSVAAPTAGLHFTDALLSRLSDAGMDIRFLTLHVGLGTFAPVRAEHIEDHNMHSESFEIGEDTAHAVTRAKHEGRPVVAVGTTSVRALESAAAGGEPDASPGRADEPDAAQRAPGTEEAGSGTANAAPGAAGRADGVRVLPGTRDTDIFIYPGYRFRVVDQLFTNFHTPESTLLMLVSAFAGQKLVLETYREAVERRYRFFSYGDAMLIR
jgi:S-adenosylmethionine:tRNA ribosyltransferase-isomerase